MVDSLTHTDRCDTCGSKALVAAEVNDTWLMFCGHHANKYEDKLRSVSSGWIDDRNQTNSFSPNLTVEEEPVKVEVSAS